MLLWSVVPEEFVFEGMDKCEYNWIEANVQGVQMLVEASSQQPGYAKIVRLLSPDPQHYLNPAFQPGSMVCLVPQS